MGLRTVWIEFLDLGLESAWKAIDCDKSTATACTTTATHHTHFPARCNLLVVGGTHNATIYQLLIGYT